MKRIGLVGMLGIVAALAPSAPAAGAPITLGNGEHPRVATDAAGIAYVVWTQVVPDSSPAGDDITHFCKVAPGGRACSAGSSRTFAPNPGPSSDDDNGNGPVVFVSGRAVVVGLTRTSSQTGSEITFAAVSGNGGATFGAPQVIGALGTFAYGDALQLPSGAIGVIDSTHTGGDRFQRQPLSGTAPTAQQVANLGDNGGGTPFEAQSALGSFGTATQDRLVAVMQQIGGTTQMAYRVYAGTGGAANTLAGWSAPVALGTGFYPRICDGPGAPDLIYTTQLVAQGPLLRRRFDLAKRTFGPASPVIASGVRERFDCAHDGTGHEVVVYWSDAGQRVWTSASPGKTAPLNSETPSPLPSIAVDRDGGGWLAYRNDQGLVRLQPLSDAAQPVLGQAVVVGPVSGTVKVRRRGSRRFTTLRAGQAVPPGSELDTTSGTVAVTSARDRRGNRQTALFRAGVFTLAQSRRAALTTAVLSGTETRSCAGASAARRKRRRLFGSGKGAFRTQGHYGAASIRGTRWLVEDFCDRTRITDLEGTVTATDLVRHRTVVLHTGQSYTALAR